MNGLGRPSVRAVVYTRKSSEEGLDQEFNSLDAQYEACTAYIASQRHEGWKLVKQRFDDGGVSGGTMDRPALKALLDEVDKGLIDMIVVYKIDRLTRSLSDFARLIERLEQAGCSFVSVTQSFNTSSSMGRLTLNGTVTPIRTPITSLAQPKSMRSIIDATQREQRHGLA